jgi:DNA primase large subunit
MAAAAMELRRLRQFGQTSVRRPLTEKALGGAKQRGSRVPKDSADDVGDAGTLNDQARPLVSHPIADFAGLFVAAVAGQK